MTETNTNCTKCSNNCPLGSLRCGRGIRYLEELHSQGIAQEIMPGAQKEQSQQIRQLQQEQRGGRERERYGRHRHGCGGEPQTDHRSLRGHEYK